MLPNPSLFVRYTDSSLMATFPRERRPLKMHGATIPLAALLIAGLLTGCSSKDAYVKAVHAEMQPITRTSSANGKVELLQDFEAHSAGAGQVKEIFVKMGQQVQA